MSIYPPNTTPPKKGLNYLWNYLGSSLKTFANALSPYLTGSGGLNYKVYSAAIYQIGTDPIQAQIFENTIDPEAYWVNVDPGYYELRFPSLLPEFDGFNGNKLWINNSASFSTSGTVMNVLYNYLTNEFYYYTLYPTALAGGNESYWPVSGVSLEVINASESYFDLSVPLNSPFSGTLPTKIYIEIRLYP